MFMTLIMLIAMGYLFYLYKSKHPKFRVVLTDPVTGYIKYLSSVDGINGSFQYAASADGAIIFNDANRAETFAREVGPNAQPVIEKKILLLWKTDGRVF